MVFSQESEVALKPTSDTQSVSLTLVGGRGTGCAGNKCGCFSPRTLQAVMLFG